MIAFAATLIAGAAALVAAAVAPLAAAQADSASTSVARARTPLPYQSVDPTVGIVNCASALCHGSTSPAATSNVLQTEYVTWSHVDKHARAFLTLGSARSERMGRKLGIADPAQSKLCLDCHSHNVPAARRGERFRLEDGVSCETCHGPAGRWLPAHIETGATHDRNVASGLYDVSDPVSRARLCLSCHFGNTDRFVTHRLMAAGHPRMSFELDTFTSIEPAHYKPHSDAEKRKLAWDGVRVWAIGQAMAVGELTAALADPARVRDGLFPELVLFDCHACHHPMSDKRWVPRMAGLGPGAVRLNDSSLLMTRQLAKVVDDGFGARVGQSIDRLQQAVAGQGGSPEAAARAVNGQMEELIIKLQTQMFDAPELRVVLTGLIDDGVHGQYRDYAGAEQATMAISSVAKFMHQSGILKSATDFNRALAGVYAAVADDERYRPAQFQAALRSLKGAAGL